ncbi:response regulator transcription factor [Thermoactinomyces mirandus]|uniref:Response regulator transcription factor n=1 Tax=Thermoactinomyces mirandus TaxID=2756294 RepID=A0A7W2AQ16_9BACL|nr:response regulator transcription factor [Thermoactinomyces mirandus]MBA4601013.1 response regulator transcription factor [Thermoactinomyces mirandus]
MQIRILLVEDDQKINQLVCNALKKEGYTVDPCYDGLQAFQNFKNFDYHLVILDLMLPGIDGLDLLRQFRMDDNVPIMILSAKTEEMDKVYGLGLGADDYMIKPFSVSELVARVKAHLRRYMILNHSERPNGRKIKLGDLELDLHEYTVSKGEQKQNLTRIEFELLKLFMTNPRRVFTKTQIYDAIWEDSFVTDENTVMVHIRRLRTKIEDDPSKPRYIKTVWGIGYKWGGEE